MLHVESEPRGKKHLDNQCRASAAAATKGDNPPRRIAARRRSDDASATIEMVVVEPSHPHTSRPLSYRACPAATGAYDHQCQCQYGRAQIAPPTVPTLIFLGIAPLSTEQFSPAPFHFLQSHESGPPTFFSFFVPSPDRFDVTMT